MTNIFDKLIDILIAVVILFLFPMIYFGLRQDNITQQVVSAEVNRFVDNVRTQGYLNKEMYENLLVRLDATNILYGIELERKALNLEPEYRLKTADEVIEEQNAAWGGSNDYTYTPVYSEPPAIDDPVNNEGLTMNSETNESVLAKSVSTPFDPSHVHTNSCYEIGTKHVHTGNSVSGGGCYGSSTTGSRYCGSFDTYEKTEYHHYYRCSYCGQTASAWNQSTSSTPPFSQCSSCMKSYTYVQYQMDTHVYYGCSGCSAISETQGSKHYVTTTVYALNCGKVEGKYYDGNTEILPACSLIISSMNATHPIQTVYLGDPLITTAVIQFLDGSTNVQICSADFVPDTVVSNKVVTLTYNGFTTTITITVIPKTKTCVNGHTYNLNSDGSDPGCPYCVGWLQSLIVLTPSTGEITIYKGTTLEENGVVLQATYFNGSTEQVYSGYVNNLDTSYVGVQNVTIGYKGKYTTLKVTSKRNLIKCDVCGKYYELYPDGSDPGCPYCAALIPVFTGNVLKYFTETFSDDILKEMYEGSGTYQFNSGDYFSIHITNRNQTIGTKLAGLVIHNLAQTSIHVEYGGDIRDVSKPN